MKCDYDREEQERRKRCGKKEEGLEERKTGGWLEGRWVIWRMR